MTTPEQTSLAAWLIAMEDMHGVPWDRMLDLVWDEDERRGYNHNIPSVFG